MTLTRRPVPRETDIPSGCTRKSAYEKHGHLGEHTTRRVRVGGGCMHARRVWGGVEYRAGRDMREKWSKTMSKLPLPYLAEPGPHRFGLRGDLARRVGRRGRRHLSQDTKNTQGLPAIGVNILAIGVDILFAPTDVLSILTANLYQHPTSMLVLRNFRQSFEYTKTIRKVGQCRGDEGMPAPSARR